MKEKAEGSLIILNRSVVIGIIVLITTVSFTFGYFAGRYSSKRPEAQPPLEKKPEIAQEPSREETGAPEKELSRESPPSITEKTPSLEAQPQPPLLKAVPHDSQQKPPDKEDTFKKDFYYLQVGAFKDEGRAKKMSEHFKKESYDVIIKKEQGLYRVYVGTFKTKKEALFAQTRVRKLYKMEPLIIKK